MTRKTRRTRTGCLTCRDRHVKCDESYPRCRRCQKIGRECIRGWNVKFVHGVRTTREAVDDDWDGSADYRFDVDQEWTPIKHLNMAFVDETEETSSWYKGLDLHILGPPDETQKSLTPSDPSLQSPVSQIPKITRHRSHSQSSILVQSQYSQIRSPPIGTEESLRRHSSPFISSPDSSIHDPFVSHYANHGVVDSSLGLLRDAKYLSSTVSTSQIGLGQNFKVASCDEAYLVHHYVHKRGPLLDVCDPLSHFGRLVPELALTSPLLYNSLLAVSAHDLSRTAGYDSMMAELYHERCVELLIPMLDDLSVVSEDVVAATVLLRNYEQMASAITGVDCERHLSGTCAFMNSERSSATAGGLRQASFWIFVRQDLDVALSQQRPLKLDLDAFAADMGDSNVPRDDCDWANRMVWVTAEVVAFAFGWDKSRVRYEELRTKTLFWWQRKPKSFRPLHYAAGQAFPTIYFSQPCHAIGMQYYCITMILLALSDSHRLKIGFGHKESRRQLQTEIGNYADLLFGTCISADDPETKITACNAVSVCAPWLSDLARQESLIDMLHGLERDVAWPTKSVLLAAMAEWGWKEAPQT